MRKTFTFLFLIIAIIGIILNVVGIDDIGLYIGFNPILNMLSSSSLCTFINRIPYLWYILSILTMTMYGFVIDYMRDRW